MTKASKVLMRLDLVDHLPQKIWDELDPYNSDTWGLPEDQTTLAGIADEQETAKLYDITDKAAQNIALRKLLENPLRSSDIKTRARAMTWVVVDWGKIQKGSDTVADWANELSTYSDEEVQTFIEKRPTKRISSWSKVLAFADCEKYAIYDSRVAITLNAILDKHGFSQRFFMPDAQNKDLNGLAKHVKKHVDSVFDGRRNRYAGYDEYKLLLDEIVRQGLSHSILEIEMRMFDSGPKWAVEYAKKYNLPYKIKAKRRSNVGNSDI